MFIVYDWVYLCFNILIMNNDITKYFNKSKPFTKNDLLGYYLQNEKSVNNNTLLYRIAKLKKENIIKSIGKGIYLITDKKIFQPESDNLMKKMKKIFSSTYEDINYCIWKSNFLYSFMVHQPIISFYVFEVEKDVLKETFNLLKDNDLNAFYQPNEEIIDNYLSHTKNAIIIKPLISKSPVYQSKSVKIASIEKILVDIYYDRETYPVFNLSEQKNIFENINENYILNFSKLFTYSGRRSGKNGYKEFIKTNFENLVYQK